MTSRIATAALALVGTAATLIRLAPSPLRLASTLGAVDAGSAPPEHGVVALLAVVGWLCAAWLLLSVVLTAVGTAPGVVGRASGYAARQVAPRVLRRAVEAAFGLSVVAGSLSPVAAYADPSVPFESASPVLGDVGPFDRPVVSGSRAAGPSPTSTTAPTSTADATAHATPPATSALPSATPRPVAPPATSFLVVVPAPSSPTSSAGVDGDGSWDPRPPADRPVGAPASPDLLTGPSAAGDADEVVVVRRGDSLWSLAAGRLGTTATPAEIDAEWRRWYAANRAVVGADPDLILPGQRLRAPGTDSTSTPSTSQATTTRSTP